jgi:hypothetical protein
MTNKTVHIILFDVPYPANYGGIIDVFYKLKSLHKLGVNIICHCYYYEGHNEPTAQLNNYCDTVYYYKRKAQLSKLIFSKLPYIIASRSDQNLLNNLLKDNHPILFEGLHTCFYLSHPQLKNRLKIVRTHNIEHDYYNGLAKVEGNFLKQLYLKKEAKKLKQFEYNLTFANYLLSISKMDISHFGQYSKTLHIPPFFNQKHSKNIESIKNETKFCLFQGNLSVAENIDAVDFILNEIAPKCQHLIKIVGKNPNQYLKNKIETIDNVLLIQNPTEEEMTHEIQTAQVNLLFTFQQTGVKLKLINALQQGKHVIINSLMDDSNIFSDLCFIKDAPEDILSTIDKLMFEPFTLSNSEKRYKQFLLYFDTTKNAKQILDLI